ncbi:MAG: serine protease [Elusimicrobiota bacterium]
MPKALFAEKSPRPDVIYGDDDRLDIYEVQAGRLRELADSTVGLFSASDVELDESGTRATLNTSSYGDSYSLCSDEPFRDQRTGAFCSGSLVGPDLIMTAGHCVRSQSSCEGTKFVFGFAIHEKGVLPESVPAGDVYGCVELMAREEQSSGPDWALIRIDRPVTDHALLKVNRSEVLAKGAPLFVIGHPAGLPTKVAGGASVRDFERNGYFIANLDTYGGNSGSAVFNAVTGNVEGILVRGEQDFVWADGCRRSRVCSDDGCRGEDVTKVGALASRIPDIGPSSAFVKPGPAYSALRKIGGAAIEPVVP